MTILLYLNSYGPRFGRHDTLTSMYLWNSSNSLWADGAGEQEPYVNSVQMRCMFHDTLPESNVNKIHPTSCGRILQSQLLGRAEALADDLNDSVLCSENGVQENADAIYKIYSLLIEKLCTRNILSFV